MEIVGIRKLKANLSGYLAKAKSGERIVVTDRKKEIAVISPWGEEIDNAGVLSLIKKGIADWAGGKPSGMRTRVISRAGKVSDAVLEGRR